MRLDGWVRRWRREFARWLWLEHGSRVLAAAAAAVAGVLVLDALIVLPLEARWAVWVLGVGALAWAAYRRLLAPWRELRPQTLLRRAEERSPELAAYLVSAWELKGGAAPGTSQDLAAEHRSRADRLLAETRELPPLYPARLSDPGRRAVLWAAAWSVAAGAWLWRASPGLERVLAPWREVALDELVAVSPGDARPPWGSTLELVAEWRDRRRDRLELWLKTGPSALGRVPWDSEDRGRFLLRIPQLNAPAEYQVRWRGQRSKRYRLEPVPRPQLVGARLRVYPPGRQTGSFQEIALEGAGEVSALRGSWLVAMGKPNLPLSRAALKVSFLFTPVEMRAAADGAWEAGFPLHEDGRLQFDLVSQEGATDPSPISYSLKALADEPPRVDLLSPAFEVEASPRDRLPVSYHAEDDYGIASVWLVYRFNGSGGPVERSVQLPKAGSGREAYGDFAWELSALPVGTRVEFQVKVVDNASPRGQDGWSQKGYVNVADFAAAHAEAQRQWLGLEQTLGRLAEQEAEMRRLAEEAARDPAAAAAQEARREALGRELDFNWEGAAKQAKDFAEAMSKDAYANPGAAAEAQQLAQSLQEAASQELPAAGKAMKERRFEEGARRHARLEERAKGAARRLGEARQLQGLQDFWNEADRLDQAGSELSKALSEMAQGRKPSAEEKKRLDEALNKLQQAMEELAKQIASLPKAQEGSPEDKARKTYQVPLGQAMRAADALQRALAAGDYAAAARLAQQLADQLSKVRQAIGDAARDQAGGMGGGEDRLSEKLEQAGAQWDEVIADQTKTLGQTQKLEDEKTKALLEKQNELLERLREQQAEAVRRGRALGGRMPMDALSWMQATLSEFERKAVAQAPEHLRHAINRLRAQAQVDSVAAADFNDIASREEEILESLSAGAKPPPPGPERIQASRSAGESQAQVRHKTEALQRRIEELSREAGALPNAVTEPLSGAQQEQRGAEESLGRSDSGRAVQQEQAALDHLDRGRKALEQAAQQQAQIESGMRRSFDRRGGGVRRAGGGRGGADTGFVPLPSAKDYQPPRELRQELERSSNERRPPAYDPVIKEYLRRMSE
ncbi:MAG: DUF4175 family protein [Elusimicrobia bacterium]|nr:DUF4175 family protein [Elusimicrobiota bacterium]